jgi:tripartite-type tricarboxylate transporter receptor subunit TctC
MKALRAVVTSGGIVGLIVAVWSTHPAQALDWPNRPMTMVAPFAAGGTTDAIARIFADGLSSRLGQPVIIENIGGAGGMTGANRVAKAKPDGYQFVLGSVGTHAMNQSLYKQPLYNAVVDFVPVILVSEQPNVLVTRNDFPANNIKEFIAYSKASQAQLQYGSAGTGGNNHLACVLLNAAIGLNVTHVPYRSGGQAMQDLIAGRIDYQCPTGAVAIPQIAGKTVKALAILSKNRSPILPDLASAHEQGLVGFDCQNWYAIFLPKGTPAPIVQKLHDAALSTMDNPSTQARLKEIGSDLIASERRSMAYLQKFVESEIEKWAGPIKASGIQF